jgi:anti-sigma regulatory factor (Ser/Thr protein kinase)
MTVDDVLRDAEELGLATGRVWLIGDDEVVAARMAGWFGAAGYGSERLSISAAEARLATQAFAVDGVVLDPGGHHPGRLNVLDPLLRAGVPVVMLVDSESFPEMAGGLSQGVTRFLRKPVDREAFEATMAADLPELALNLGGHFLFRTLDDIADLSQLVAGLCPDPEMVQIGLSELMLNAVEHGNLGIGFVRKGELMQEGTWRNELERLLRMPANQQRFASLQVECRDDGVRFVIRDQGAGFDPRPYLHFNPERSMELHGRGIAIARLVAFPELNFQDGGRCVEGFVRRGI